MFEFSLFLNLSKTLPNENTSAQYSDNMYVQSMPKMPGGDDGEKKEETAESREEAKEQVS